LGGYLTDWTWRAIFWINIPIAIIALALLARQVVPSNRKEQSIDWQGAAIIAASMIVAIIGLQQASVWGWGSALTWTFFGVGLVLLIAFVLSEKDRAYALVRLKAFRERTFTISVLATLFASMAFVPIFFFLSVYAQIALGLDVYQSALLLLEFFIGFVIAANVGGRIFDKRGVRPLLIIGGALGAASFAWWASKLGILTDGSAFLESPQFWPTVLSGAGIGLMYSGAATDVANRAKGQSYGEATGISQTAKNFGGAFGLAVLAAVLSTQLSTNLTASFTALGAPASVSKSIASSINGNSGGSASDRQQFSALPQHVQLQVKHDIQSDYADASKSAFYGMSAAMLIVFLLGVAYPRMQTEKSAS
ncbi:MAG TPA: MFS transporter, partial [Candidatus Saccharimonadales bacterium]|nr:MFS transporter [Candidatus Saccharimonadales bacterium]